jgi:hypothetical protein
LMVVSVCAYIVRQVAVINGTIWHVVVGRLAERVQSREIDSFRRPRPCVVIDHDIYHKILPHE